MVGIRLFALVFIAWMVPSPAHAWFPPSHYVISQKFLQKRERIKTLWLKSNATLFEGEVPTPTSLTEVFQWDAAAQMWQLKIFNPAGVELYVYQRKGIGPQSIVQGIDPSTPPIATYFFVEPQADRVVQALGKWGIHLKTEADLAGFKDDARRRSYDPFLLKRWKGGFDWAVGGYDRSQIWVEKDRLLPHRFLLMPKKGSISGPVSYEFEFPDGNVSDWAFPKATTVVVQQRTLFKVETVQTVFNGKLEVLPATTVWGYTEAGKDADERTHELIDSLILYLR